MNIEELVQMYNRKLHKLKDENFYKNILTYNNNLGRFNIINRILIRVQNKQAIDVKTLEEWSIEGRNVSKDAKPIYLIHPIFKIKYISTKTDKEVENMDLNPIEINKALELGIITKIEDVSDLDKQIVYDISDTKSFDNRKYSIDKTVISAENILNSISLLTGREIVIANSDKFNKNFINIKNYKNITDLCINLSKIVANIYADTVDIKCKELFIKSLQYSICSVFNVKYDVQITELDDLELNNIILVADNVNNIIFKLKSLVDTSNNKEFIDATVKLNKVHKAEIILNMMEALYINKRMKGN